MSGALLHVGRDRMGRDAQSGLDRIRQKTLCADARGLHFRDVALDTIEFEVFLMVVKGAVTDHIDSVSAAIPLATITLWASVSVWKYVTCCGRAAWGTRQSLVPFTNAKALITQPSTTMPWSPVTVRSRLGWSRLGWSRLGWSRPNVQARIRTTEIAVV
jgi:hypothetical protein